MREINKIAEALFEKIRDRFEDVSLGDENAKATQNPEDARFFNFDYVVDGESHGNITMSLIDESSLKVYFSKNMTTNLDDPHKKDWYNFLRELREFARRNLLSFEPRDITRSTLKHRDVQTVSKADSTYTKDEIVTESRMYGTLNRSYESFGPVRIKIAHSKPIVDETKGGRSRNIAAIYVENKQGERFRMPFNSIVGARAMARHVSAGGVPTDEIGQHITGIVNEMLTLRPFVHSMRHRTFEDVETVEMLESAFEYHGLLKNTLKKLKGKKGYTEFKENFKPMVVETETDVDDIKEKFVKKVFPDKLAEALPIVQKAYEMKKSDNNPLLKTFEDWANRLSEGTWAVPNNEEQQRELKELLEEPLPVGVDAANATAALYNLIGDDELYDELGAMAKEDPEADARGMIADWLMDNGYEDLVPEEFMQNNTNGSAMGGVDGVVTESDDSFEAVQSAIIRRIIHAHLDVLKVFGPDAIAQAAEDTAAFVGDVDEIGTSDVSAWTRQTIDSLQRGDYNNIKETAAEAEHDEAGNPIKPIDGAFATYFRKKGSQGSKWFAGTKHPHRDDAERAARKILSQHPGYEYIIREERQKTRSPVAKNAPRSGAGAHKDRKRADKQGEVKHKHKAKDDEQLNEKQHQPGTALRILAKIPEGYKGPRLYEKIMNTIVKKLGPMGTDLERKEMYQSLAADVMEKYMAKHKVTVKESHDADSAGAVAKIIAELISDGHTEVSPDVIMTKVSAALGRPFMLKDLVAANNGSQQLQRYISSINPTKIKFSTDLLTVKNENPEKKKQQAQTAVSSMASRAANRPRLGESKKNLSELSPELRGRYSKAAQTDMARHATAAKIKRSVYGADNPQSQEHEKRADKREQGLARASKTKMNEDRGSLEKKKILLVRRSDAIDQIITKLDAAKNYQAAGRVNDAQRTISDAMGIFTDTFDGKIPRSQFEDVLVPLDWCENALQSDNWDPTVMNQTIDISLNLLDQMNDQIWSEIMQPEKDEEEGGISVGELRESGETYIWTAEFADGSREQLTITTDEVPYAKAAFEKKFPNKQLTKVDTDWKPVGGSYYSGMPTTAMPDRRPTEPYGRDIDNPMVREMKKKKLRGAAGKMVENFASELDSIIEEGVLKDSNIVMERVIDVDGFQFDVDVVVQALRDWYNYIDTGDYLDDTTAEDIEHALTTAEDYHQQLWDEMQALPRPQFSRVIGQIVNFASRAASEDYDAWEREESEQSQQPRITHRDNDDEEGGFGVGDLREGIKARVRAMNYDRLARRTMKQADKHFDDTMDMDLDWASDERIDRDQEWGQLMDKSRNRRAKASTIRTLDKAMREETNKEIKEMHDDELDGNPYEMGYRAAALYSKSKNSNPFEYNDPRHDEWLDGWREGSTYEDGFFEGSEDDEVAAARAARAKIDKPAVFRKQEKFLPSKGDDWKVSHQDLEKAGSLHSKEFDARKKAAGLDEALADMRRLAGLK